MKKKAKGLILDKVAAADNAPADNGMAAVAAQTDASVAETACLKADDETEETGCSGCSGCSCNPGGEGSFMARIEAMIVEWLFGWLAF